MMPVKQQTFFDLEKYHVIPDNWCSDDWETPSPVARSLASLVLPEEKVIVEPAAGRGAIAQYLPAGTTCIEINPIRHVAGAVSYQNWLCTNYLQWIASDEAPKQIDLVIGNLPFSLAIDFIEASASKLSEKGRMLLLLPSDYLQTKKVARRFRRTGLSATHKWEVVGRVGYVQEGIVQDQRQCSDSIFEFKAGVPAAVELIDPYKRLK